MVVVVTGAGVGTGFGADVLAGGVAALGAVVLVAGPASLGVAAGEGVSGRGRAVLAA